MHHGGQRAENESWPADGKCSDHGHIDWLLASTRGAKLTAHEFEETTWSARSWFSFAKQQVSVALHRAVAWEIGNALRIAARAGADPRGAYLAA